MVLTTLALIASVATLASAQSPSQPAPAKTIIVLGSIEAFWSADQYAKDSGYISEVTADIGDHVKKGQTLAVIDDPELEKQIATAQANLVVRQQMTVAADAAIAQSQAAVEVAQSQLLGLEADVKLADITLKRQEELFVQKAATEQHLDETRAKTEITRAALAVGKAKIAAAQADLRAAQANRLVAAAHVDAATADLDRLKTLQTYTKIVAPFDSVVTRRWVNPGDLVQSAISNRPASALFTCQKLDTLRLFCEVPETASSSIHPGDPADIQLTGTQSAGATVLHAKVTRIASSISPQSRTMRTEIDLENPDAKLLPGTYAQVTLTPATQPTTSR